MSPNTELINLFDFEAAARERLDPVDWDYIAGGATDEITLARTRRAYDAIALRPRVLRGIERPDLSTTVLGRKISFPVLLAPVGSHQRRAHPDGELATAQAAAAAGTIMVVSANANYTFEEIAQVAGAHLWLQLYLFRDRALTKSWVRRAEEAGYAAICVTLDSHWPSKRERNIRNHYRAEPAINYGDFRVESLSRMEGGHSLWTSAVRTLVDPAASWEDLAWLKAQTHLPIVAKGIMTGEDAALCVEHGIDALIVSNHGGRNLDSTLATIEVLPEVVDAVQGCAEVLLDGGIRRGADVVKALALGAKAILIGRPIVWGLAVGGQEGLSHVLEILRDEIESTMALCGRPTIDSIDASLVVKAPPV